MTNQQIIELSSQMVIYQALFEVLDEPMQDKLALRQQQSFEKFQPFASQIDGLVVPHVEAIAEALEIYTNTLLDDILAKSEALVAELTAPEDGPL